MKLAASNNMVKNWLSNLQLLKELLDVTKAKMKGLIKNLMVTIPGKIHHIDIAEDSQKLQLLKETVDNIAQNIWRSTARIRRSRRTGLTNSSRRSKTDLPPYRRKRPSWRSTKHTAALGYQIHNKMQDAGEKATTNKKDNKDLKITSFSPKKSRAPSTLNRRTKQRKVTS